MRFWDTSALVPLLCLEDASAAASALYRDDPIVAVAWTSAVECASAIARLEHDQLLNAAQATHAFARLDELTRTWREIEPTNEIRDIARRLLRAYRLRAGDAIQIASATLAAERRPATIEFVTLDARVETAAQKEGFRVIFPGREPDTHTEPPRQTST